MGLPYISISFAPSEKINNLNLLMGDSTIPLRKFDNNHSTLIVLGTPILGEKITYDRIWSQVTNKGLRPEFLRQVNGEFLFLTLDKKSMSLRVSTDRYASIPFFYTSDNSSFFGSVFYKDLWEHMRLKNRLKLNEHAIFEFLWLQRLLGTKTYDSNSSFLLAATSVTYQSGNITTESYWRPSFVKTGAPVKDTARQLAKLLRQSAKRKTSDQPGQVGMFLSGGTDSRTVLAAFEEPPSSFTIGVSDNNEVKIARTVASQVRSPHQFIPISQDPYSGNLDAMTMLGGGMHAFDHGIFYHLKQGMPKEIDVNFHGHGIDYMFQGMYLLTRNLTLLGRRTSFKKSVQIGDDFPNEYLYRIGHRLKDINLLEYVMPGRRTDMLSQLQQSVADIQKLGQDFCNTLDDHWEYMLIHALSRHYPFTNLSSMATIAEQRTIAFDNDIFNLYLSLPKSHRIDGRIAKMALKILNPDLAAIPTANINQRPDHSPLARDARKFLRLVRDHMGPLRSNYVSPTAEQRTWPDRGRIFATQKRLINIAIELQTSDALGSLGFIDMDRLARDIPHWIKTPNYGAGSFLSFLITVDRFIKHDT
ncbi:MAG: asparagine synthase-related protein [Chloroflexota bacterium]|nr:asparagine synthase-related protein [Chloroflexota bacterium]